MKEIELDIWVKQGMIVTMDEAERVLSPGDLWVKGGRIEAISPSDEGSYTLKAKKVLDASGCLVLPGLINAHTHLPMSILRGLSDDLPLKEWLFKHIFPAEAKHMTPENVYWASLWSCVELISSGVTCVMDGYFFEEEVARAIDLAGIRGVVGQGILDLPTPDTKDPKDNMKRAAEFLDAILGQYPKIVPSLFCHSPLTVGKDTLADAKRLCSDHNLLLQMHVSETQEEFKGFFKEKGISPVAYLNSLEILDKDFVAVHLVHATDEDMELIHEKGVKVVHCPESNMKLASGTARIWEMVKRGIRVGVGTDSPASNNNLDLFRELDTATKLQKVFLGDATALPAKQALKMATCWGAYVVGMEETIGSLEVGKEADFIVVDLNSPHLFPVYDPFSLAVYSLKASDVRDVVVGGKLLMEDRQIKDLDLKEIHSRLKRICRYISR